MKKESEKSWDKEKKRKEVSFGKMLSKKKIFASDHSILEENVKKKKKERKVFRVLLSQFRQSSFR